MMIHYHQSIQDQLIYHEGVQLKPYKCPAGKLTIGVGRNLDDTGISCQEAMHLLKNDIENCEADLMYFFGRDVFLSFPDGRKRALIDLRFNIGPTRFRGFQKMISSVRRGDWTEAAAQLKDSLWWKQVQANRRDTLYHQLLTGEP